MLRAEALLQIGRKGDALAELDRLSLAQMPNSDEPHVLRGELRAAVGRWREALADFDVVLPVMPGKAPKSGHQPTRKRTDAWNARCGPGPGPQPPGRRRRRTRGLAGMSPPLSWRTFRLRSGPPAW